MVTVDKTDLNIANMEGNMTYEELLDEEFGASELIHYENQNKEYRGMLLKTIPKNQIIRTRLAKKTAKKAGYFVAFWEKNNENTNVAYDKKNPADFLCIVVTENHLQGVFVFPKHVLVEKGILRSAGAKGKMAARFYPAWCRDLNKTAQKTQDWQLAFFKDYTTEES